MRRTGPRMTLPALCCTCPAHSRHTTNHTWPLSAADSCPACTGHSCSAQALAGTCPPRISGRHSSQGLGSTGTCPQRMACTPARCPFPSRMSIPPFRTRCMPTWPPLRIPAGRFPRDTSSSWSWQWPPSTAGMCQGCTGCRPPTEKPPWQSGTSPSCTPHSPC